MNLKILFKLYIPVAILLIIGHHFMLGSEVFAESACANFAVALIARGSLSTRRSRHCNRVNFPQIL